MQNNTFIKGNPIVLGDLRLQGSGRAATSAGDASPNYQVFIPTDARKEYYHKAGCTHTTAQNVWDTAGWINGAQATLDSIMVHGLVYVGEDFEASAGGNKKIVGVVICKGEADNLTGNAAIYFNQQVADNIEYQDMQFNRESWLEFAPGSWSNPNW